MIIINFNENKNWQVQLLSLSDSEEERIFSIVLNKKQSYNIKLTDYQGFNNFIFKTDEIDFSYYLPDFIFSKCINREKFINIQN